MERNNFLNEYLNVDIRITESTFASFTRVFKSKLAFELAKWRRKFFHHPKVPLSSRSTRSLNRSKSRFTYLLKIQDHHIHLCTNTIKKTVELLTAHSSQTISKKKKIENQFQTNASSTSFYSSTQFIYTKLHNINPIKTQSKPKSHDKR